MRSRLETTNELATKSVSVHFLNSFRCSFSTNKFPLLQLFPFDKAQGFLTAEEFPFVWKVTYLGTLEPRTSNMWKVE